MRYGNWNAWGTWEQPDYLPYGYMSRTRTVRSGEDEYLRLICVFRRYILRPTDQDYYPPRPNQRSYWVTPLVISAQGHNYTCQSIADAAAFLGAYKSKKEALCGFRNFATWISLNQPIQNMEPWRRPRAPRIALPRTADQPLPPAPQRMDDNINKKLASTPVIQRDRFDMI